ncbi:MAG: DUF192 domain-containing protein [Endomicrobium sp.]|jgi:uncharacterized membrane protein (UPF0127 family)|nr:DUF192 domain-containing protein [Endomicrobium sp.]
MKNIKLGINVIKANTFWERFWGFMFKRDANYAIFFNNCRSVHTFFVLFNLDIIYLDKENNVVKIIKSLKPFRITLPVQNSVSIIEIPSKMVNIEKVLLCEKFDLDFK